MSSRSHLEVRPVTVIKSAVGVMSVPSIGKARYFVTFTDKASGHVKSFAIK